MVVRRPPKQLGRARAMRCEPTKAEDILWRSLRSAALGAKFRRQVPIGSFIADFACLTAKLVVELGGPPHDTVEQHNRDVARDRWLNEHSWRVLRIPNDVVFGGGDMVIDRIKNALHSGPSSDPTSSGHLLPQAGEGEVSR